MSTPQTLTQALPPHYHFDPRQQYLPSPQERFLPPPRPTSSISTGLRQAIPARPSSNMSNPSMAIPARTHSGMSNGYSHAHGQARSGAEYTHNGDVLQRASHEELGRSNNVPSQSVKQTQMPPHSRQLHRPQPHPSAQLHPTAKASAPLDRIANNSERDMSESSRKKKQKSSVNWLEFFGGKVPEEIITIHDDDSPAPPTQTHQAQAQTLPPAAEDASIAYHVDKKRRTNNGAGDAIHAGRQARHSNLNSTSTDSLQASTAATSLPSQASSTGPLTGEQTGQKRKRTTRGSEMERKKQEIEQAESKGYLAEYGEYIPPPKMKKQKEVHVPLVVERYKPTEKTHDEDGHYIVHENSRLGERYNLVSLLGQGTFGKVVKALDNKSRREVAVKIIRSVPKYRDASRIELRVLQTLRAADEHNRNRCIQLRDCFDWRGHVCIVTPLLGLSVFDFLKNGGFVPFPGSHIQAFARQLLGSIAFLHDLNLIHTDLKPENILLLNSAYQTFTYNRNIPSSSTLTTRSAKFRRVLLSPQINLIDFGSATFDDEYHSSVVSTRHYRAPEIILGIGWSHPIDMWSLGCILVECWTGDALFQTHDCCEHLGMMEHVIGQPIDKSLIREVQKTSKRGDRNSAARFFKNNQLAYPLTETPRQSRRFVRSMKHLDEIIPPVNNFNRYFAHLLRKIFVYDPKKRITAREALKHPWFTHMVEDDGTEAGRIRLERQRMQEVREQETRRR